MHSEKYETVKHWYDTGRWNISKVRDAVAKGWITEEEFREITERDY